MSKFTIKDYGLSEFNASRLPLEDSPKKVQGRIVEPNPNIGPQRKRIYRSKHRKSKSPSPSKKDLQSSIFNKLEKLSLRGGFRKSKSKSKTKKSKKHNKSKKSKK